MPSRSKRVQTIVARRSDEFGTFCNGVPFGPDPKVTYDTVETERLDKTWGNTAGYRALVRAKARVPDQPLYVEAERRPDNTIHYDTSRSNACSSGWDKGVIQSYYQTSYGSGGALRIVGDRLLSDDGVKSALLTKAKGAEFNAPVFFAEAGKTTSLVLKTARDLAMAFAHLKRGRLADAYRVLKMGDPNPRVEKRFNRQWGKDARGAAANRWLEMQYGWKPLLNDVKNAAEQLAEITEDRKIGRVVASDSLTTRFNGRVQVEVSPETFADRAWVSKETTRAVWLFSPTELNSLGSLGLLNPLTVVWELVPLSFVVDWMLPIGRYLEHLDAPLRFNHVGGCIGYRRAVSTVHSNFVRDGYKGSGSFSASFVRVERVPLTSVPSLGLSSLRFQPKLGVQRMLSGLALASQRFK